MDSVPIQVECYAGHKADENPRRFLCESSWIEVKEILDRWLQADKNPRQPKADYFKVLGSDGKEYLLKRDREYDEWFLVKCS